ncbi:hypothetical protein [Ketogulonicigenium vulgare]|uniref:hypothetical protein n=1 Tax=Ketogulonicigenium vulgare TaxID=92945 RepID=UPI0005C60D02|nr:hypothetical protein [Ketogulonicigenium vulgare]ALJ81564.1 hypothetical protein KVH_10490 [Ketogulonicigenium vulgare]
MTIALSRQHDELLLQALAMRQSGKPLDVIGGALGMPRSNVGLFTIAVRDADLRESGEPAAVVELGYQWKKRRGGRP